MTNNKKLDKKILKINKIAYIEPASNSNEYKEITQNNDFKKYNILYGHNASGKTTISRAIANLKLSDKEEHGVKAEFNVESNEILNTINNNINYENIFVFNRDFIDKNISSNIDNQYILLSEESINNNTKIEETKTEIESLKEKKNNMENNIKKLKRAICNKIVKYHDMWVDGHDYKTNNLEKDIEGKKYNNEKLEFNDMLQISKKLEDLKNIKFTSYEKLNQSEIINKLDTIFTQLKNIILTEPLKNKEAISRLSEDAVLNNWVKVFFDKVQEQSSEYNSTNCPFCESKYIIKDDTSERELFNDFFKRLASHYNKEYDDFVNMCNSLKKSILEIDISKIASKEKPKDYNLFDSSNTHKINHKIGEIFSLSQDITNKSFYDQVKDLIDEVEQLVELKENKIFIKETSCDKKLKEIENKWKGLKNTYCSNIKEINIYINEHNSSVKGKEDIKNGYRDQIKSYYINRYNAIYEKKYSPSFEKLKDNIKNKETRLCNLNKAKSVIEINLKKKVVPHLNKLIPNYLKLKFQIEDNDRNEISIYRDDKFFSCQKLSEGEKNIITFCYFVFLLQQYNKKSKLLIVIDDVHSSFDKINLNYVVQDLLSKEIREKLEKNILQLFLLSHEYSFIRENLFFGAFKSIIKSNKDDIFYFQCVMPEANSSMQINTIKEKENYFCPNKEYIELYKNSKKYYDEYQKDAYNAEQKFFHKVKIREFVEHIFDHMHPSFPYKDNLTDKATILGLKDTASMLNTLGHDTTEPISTEKTFKILQELFNTENIKKHFLHLKNSDK